MNNITKELDNFIFEKASKKNSNFYNITNLLYKTLIEELKVRNEKDLHVSLIMVDFRVIINISYMVSQKNKELFVNSSLYDKIHILKIEIKQNYDFTIKLFNEEDPLETWRLSNLDSFINLVFHKLDLPVIKPRIKKELNKIWKEDDAIKKE